MPTTFSSHRECYAHIQHMKASLERLVDASKKWKPDDAERGAITIKKLERQIAEAKAALQASR